MIRAVKVVLALTVALTMTAADARADDPPIAIEGATVITEPGKVVQDTTIIIRNGVITAIGKNVAVPAGAKRISGVGKTVTAGFVESSTRLGLVEVGAVSSTNEGRMSSKDGGVWASFRVTDGYNASSVAIPVARTGGVTSAISTPRGGLVSGTGAWFALAKGTTDNAIVKAPIAMYATLGEGALASTKGSRGMAIARLRELFDDAEQYRRRKGNFERNQTRRFAAKRLDLQALINVRRGDIPLVIRANRSSDILAAVRLGKELGISIIIEGGVEAWKVAVELAAAKVPVILNPVSNLPGSFDRIFVRDDAAKLLADAGVDIAISTLGDASRARTIRQRAGIAIANGLSRDDALAALTTVPAKIFGVKDRGTIAKGKVADIVVWSGDPFELSSVAEAVIIGGVQQSLVTHQTRLLQRYRTLPKRPTTPQKKRPPLVVF